MESRPVPGERTPWQQLISYLEKTNLKITSLKYVEGDWSVTAMPSKMCDGYYQAKEFRKMVFRDTETRLQGIGSIVGDKVYIIWIDEMRRITQDIRDLSSEYIHSTLRDHYGKSSTENTA
jgi:hypothetical protein